jgi:hypothetical protein
MSFPTQQEQPCAYFTKTNQLIFCGDYTRQIYFVGVIFYNVEAYGIYIKFLKIDLQELTKLEALAFSIFAIFYIC